MWAVSFIALFALAVIVANFRIVAQSDAYVIERLGSFSCIWDTGIHFKIPFIDRIASKVSLKEHVYDFRPQPVITKDNVTIMIDSVIYFQVTDPKLFTYGIVNPVSAIENLTSTTLRNIAGELELDETLTSRDIINTRMRSILDDATDPWGIKVNRVEVKNIAPPKAIQEAMEKQMRAERERRESILIAEGTKKSAILKAEGEKQSAILKAEGEKQSAILKAEAAKEAAIRTAEGEAAAIVSVQKATAEGFAFIKNAQIDASVLKLESLKTLSRVADGQATKIIVPSEIQNLAGLVTSLKETANTLS